jgi:hypothetical protein
MARASLWGSESAVTSVTDRLRALLNTASPECSARLFRSYRVSDPGSAREKPLPALDGAGELRAPVAIRTVGRAGLPVPLEQS